MTRPKTRTLILLCLLSLAVAAGFIAWRESLKTPWEISATAKRPENFGQGLKLGPNEYFLTTAGALSGDTIHVSEIPRLPLPENGVWELGGDTRIHFEAISLSIPGMRDGPWREPENLAELGDQQLPAPVGWGESPVLNLLFRAEGPEHFAAHASEVWTFDSRTSARIGVSVYGSPGFEMNMSEDESGRNWTLLSIPVGIWHDTPVDVTLEWGAGIPILSQLDPMQCTTAWFLDVGDARIHAFIDPTFDTMLDQNRTWRETREARLEPGSAKTHWFGMLDLDQPNDSRFGLAIRAEGQTEWVFEWFEGARSRWDRLGFSTAQARGLRFSGTPKEVAALRLPDSFPARLRIPGMPDMPNGRDIENLFDVRIPEVTTEDASEVVARATELNRIYFDHEIETHPLTRFKKLEAHELLQRVRKIEEVDFVVDTAGFVLRPVPHEPTFLERSKKWWNERVPDWLQFGD